MHKEKVREQNNYNLLMICDHEKLMLPQLEDLTLLNIDDFTTEFPNKYYLFDYINHNLKLNRDPNFVHFLIYNKRNNKLIEDVYYQQDRIIIDRKLIRNKLIAYLEDQKFQALYFNYYRNFKNNNVLKMITSEILTEQDPRLSTLRFNINRLITKIDPKQKGTSKVIRDAYKYIKAYEGYQEKQLKQREAKLEVPNAKNKIKERILTNKQYTIYDFMNK